MKNGIGLGMSYLINSYSTFGSGTTNKSAVLNGTTSFVSIPNSGSMAFTGDFSIQFDIKSSDDTFADRWIHKGDGTAGNWDFSIGQNASGLIYFQVRDQSVGVGHTYLWDSPGTGIVVSDGWINLHFRFDINSGGTSSDARMWVDGVEDTGKTPTENGSFVQMRNVANIEVGRRVDLSQFSAFQIDNLKIWNTAENYGTAAMAERFYEFNDDLTDSGTDGTDATGTAITYSTDVP